MFNRQDLFDKRLQCIDNKPDRLSQRLADPQDDDEMSCHDTDSSIYRYMAPARSAGLLRRIDAGIILEE